VPPQTPPVKPEKTPTDRQQRRAERRAEMVAAAMDAVRTHGPAVSVAEIAAMAGITKPVLYRHFSDRADLQKAVGEEAVSLLMGRIGPALTVDGDPPALIHGIVDAFLAGIEDEPELWRFVVHHPIERATGAEVVDDAREQIARLLTALIGERLRGQGLDSGGAEVWAQGLVGMVQSAGDWWLERRTMSRAALTGYLTSMIWGGLSGVLGEAEADPARLRVVSLAEKRTGENGGG
jgi:AcrR family transcriptional regulator